MGEFLKIVEVYNSNTSKDNERVKIEVLEDTDLSEYALVDNTFDQLGQLSNVHPHFFRFPFQLVNKGDTIYVHTGSKPSSQRTEKLRYIAKPNTYRYYCDSGNSFWNDTGDTAKLYKLHLEDEVAVPAVEKKEDKK